MDGPYPLLKYSYFSLTHSNFLRPNSFPIVSTMPSHTYFVLPVTYYLLVLLDIQLAPATSFLAPWGSRSPPITFLREIFFFSTYDVPGTVPGYTPDLCHVMFTAILQNRTPYYSVYRSGKERWGGPVSCPSLYSYLETGQGFQPRSAWFPRLVLLTVFLYCFKSHAHQFG